MELAEVIHRQKSVELENIRMVMGGELNLKLFAYPVKKQIYPGRLAFVLYYEYETLYGSNQNLDKRSGFMPRFWINDDENIKDLAKNGKLILKSHSYQDLRFKVIQMAISDSSSEDSIKASKNNIDWFNENRDNFSKRQIGANDFARDKKRIESPIQTKAQKFPVFIPEKIEETPFIEITENAIEVIKIEDAANKTATSNKIKQLVIKTPANLKGKSPGLAKFIKKHAA